MTSTPAPLAEQLKSYEEVLGQLRLAVHDSDKEGVACRAAKAQWENPLTCAQLGELIDTTSFYPARKEITKALHCQLCDAENFDSVLQMKYRWDFERDEVRRELGLIS